MLGIDKGNLAAALLCRGQHMQRQRRLAGGFRSVNLYDSAARQTADAQCGIQRQRAGRNGIHVHLWLVTQTHDRALAVVLLDLVQRRFQRFFLVVCGGRRLVSGFLRCHDQFSSLFWASTALVISAVSFFSSRIS